jgi:hypothetical protein
MAASLTLRVTIGPYTIRVNMVAEAATDKSYARQKGGPAANSPQPLHHLMQARALKSLRHNGSFYRERSVRLR